MKLETLLRESLIQDINPTFIDLEDERKDTITGLLTGALDVKTWTAGVGYESIRSQSNVIDWSASIDHQNS